MALPQISNVLKFPLSSPLSDGVGPSTPIKSLPSSSSNEIEGRGLYVIQLQTI